MAALRNSSLNNDHIEKVIYLSQEEAKSKIEPYRDQVIFMFKKRVPMKKIAADLKVKLEHLQVWRKEYLQEEVREQQADLLKTFHAAILGLLENGESEEHILSQFMLKRPFFRAWLFDNNIQVSHIPTIYDILSERSSEIRTWIAQGMGRWKIFVKLELPFNQENAEAFDYWRARTV